MATTSASTDCPAARPSSTARTPTCPSACAARACPRTSAPRSPACTIEAPNGAELGAPFPNTTYKTLRLLGERQSWLFAVWRTGQTELYDTAADPYELTNRAGDPRHEAAPHRLHALPLVTKSCAEGTCRDPWTVFAPDDGSQIATMRQALEPRHDAYFAAFPRVHFASCRQYQDVAHEAPFYPAGAGAAARPTTSPPPGPASPSRTPASTGRRRSGARRWSRSTPRRAT